MIRGLTSHSSSHIRKMSTSASHVSARGRPISLPRLPVPDLHQTLARYMASLEPLMLEDEKKGKTSYESSYALRLKGMQAFESGIGQLLQDRLLGPSSVFLRNSIILRVTKHWIGRHQITGLTITSG